MISEKTGGLMRKCGVVWCSWEEGPRKIFENRMMVCSRYGFGMGVEWEICSMKVHLKKSVGIVCCNHMDQNGKGMFPTSREFHALLN